jgi:DinB family protein
MDLDWNAMLVEQLDWLWQNQARPRLEGLTDAEYFWEPVPGGWSVRPRGGADDGDLHGSGDFGLQFSYPPPEPPPVTTIAWRLAHITVGVLGMRSASHFGGPAMTWDSFPYAGSAAEALAQLESAYRNWIFGVRALGADGLARPCGPAEGPYAASPLAELVLHINREVIHHGAEIALLRDLYRAGGHAGAEGGSS